MLGSLFNKVASLNVSKFLKNRLQHRRFLWIFQSYATRPVAASGSPTTVQ